MKVLIVGGDDYSALSFEQEYKGTLISTIIDNLQDYESDEWDFEIQEFGEVDLAFSNFIKKNVLDYDHKKHTCYYLETETL